MEKEILFSESQRFKQWWAWLIVLGINGVFLFVVFGQIIAGQPDGDNAKIGTWLTVGAILSILFTLLFLNFRLETLINRDGIYVRFFPFHLKFKHFNWDSLSKSYIRKYSPISEYGGWGLRYGFFGKGKAYNVSGNKGLQLEFTNNKKLLIGTKKPNEIKETLKLIGQLRQ